MNCIDCGIKLKWYEIMCIIISYRAEINHIGNINKKPIKSRKLGLDCFSCGKIFALERGK